MNYKGIDKEKILEVQKVKLPNTDAYAIFTEEEVKVICNNTDSCERLYKGIENQLKARINDTEMAIICEMAMMYLDSLKDKETADKEAYNKGREEALQEVQNCESYGYEKGLNDAWELARKIDFFDEKERTKIFGYLTSEYIKEHYTVQEALAKLEAYEKEQEQKIVAGDIVTTINGECEYLVTSVQLPNTLHTVNTRNGYLQTMKISSAKKTGKHIDIQKILDELKEGTE